MAGDQPPSAGQPCRASPEAHPQREGHSAQRRSAVEEDEQGGVAQQAQQAQQGPLASRSDGDEVGPGIKVGAGVLAASPQTVGEEAQHSNRQLAPARKAACNGWRRGERHAVCQWRFGGRSHPSRALQPQCMRTWLGQSAATPGWLPTAGGRSPSRQRRSAGRCCRCETALPRTAAVHTTGVASKG